MTSRSGFRIPLLCAVVLILIALPACVTKTAATSTVPEVAFMVTPPSVISQGAQTQLIASLSSDPQNMGIDWIASCQSTNCGTFNPTNTLSGVATVYTAPSTVPTGCNTGSGQTPCVSLTARSHADPSQTATVTVSIITGVSIQFSEVPVGQVSAGGTTQVAATISGSASSVAQGVTWEIVNCGSQGSCGTLPQQSSSGIPVTYTAPTTVTSSFTLNIEAVAVADTNQHVTTAAIQVVPGVQPSVSFSVPPQNPINAGATDSNVVAVTTNDPGNGGIDWALQCTNSAAQGQCGTLNSGGANPTHTASGSPMTYTAPATVPSGGLQVTITIDPTDNPTATLPFAFTVSSPTLSISITTSLPTQMAPGAQAQTIAVVQNDPTSGSNGIDWMISCTKGNAPNCGTLTLVHTNDNQATTYTAPTAVPGGGGVVTITATSTAQNTLSKTETVTITAGGITLSWTNGTPPNTLQELGQESLAATVNDTNGVDTGGVDWTLACTPGNSGSCGTFATTSSCATEPCTTAHTVSAAAVVYTAPPDIPQGGTVQITADATDNPSAQLPLSITITAPTPVVTISSQVPTSLEVGTTLNMTATITNDSAPNDGASWTCTPNTPAGACGTFTNLLNQVGSSSVTYNAPATVPNTANGQVTITATPNVAPGTAANVNIDITANPNLSLLHGNYVFSVYENNAGASIVGSIGSLTADGAGNVTQVEEDNTFCGQMMGTSPGHYSIGPDGRGTMTLNFPCGLPTQTFSFTITGSLAPGAPWALVSELDSNQASGRLDAQVSPALPAANSNFAFLFDGIDNNNPPNPNTFISTTDMGGVITVNSATSWSSQPDINDQTLPAETRPQITWTVSSLDGFGRGSATGSDKNSNQYSLAFYVVNSGMIQFLENDNYIEIGPGFTSSNTFSGVYAFTLAGTDGSNFNTVGLGLPLVAAGVFDANNKALTNTNIDINDQGTLGDNQPLSGSGASYTDASNGRGTITISVAPLASQGVSAPAMSSFAYYPTANNGVLLLEIDNDVKINGQSAGGGFVTTGVALAQAAVPVSFTGGAYATNLTSGPSVDGPLVDVVGQVNGDGATDFIGTVDGLIGGNSFSANPLAGSYSATSTSPAGRFTGSFNFTVGTQNQKYSQVFYTVDNNPSPLNPINTVMGKILSADPGAPPSSCSPANACVVFTAAPNGTQSIGVLITTPAGTTQAASGTFVIESSPDGSTWSNATSCSAGGANPNQVSGPSLTTCSAGGNLNFRVRATALTNPAEVAIMADTEQTFTAQTGSVDPNGPPFAPSGTNPVACTANQQGTFSSQLYFDTQTAQLFYCTGTDTWGQFTGTGPNTVLFMENDTQQQTTGIMKLQSLP